MWHACFILSVESALFPQRPSHSGDQTFLAGLGEGNGTCRCKTGRVLELNICKTKRRLGSLTHSHGKDSRALLLLNGAGIKVLCGDKEENKLLGV